MLMKLLKWISSIVLRKQKVTDSELTVIVCPGADGTFSLYEDAGDGYGYENGEYTLTRFEWSDGKKELTENGKKTGYRYVLHS